MIQTATDPRKTTPIEPLLYDGQRLSQREFHRRYELCPELKNVELIDGVVYMASPVNSQKHGHPHFNLAGVFNHYGFSTPGVLGAIESSIEFSDRDELQPDLLLWIGEEFGGRARHDPDGYLVGPLDLVAEIASSSKAKDIGPKFESYQREGVREYLVWRVKDREIDWWELTDGEYRPLPRDEHGVIRSRVFPGLWLDVPALLDGNLTKLRETLELGLKSTEHAEFVVHLASKERQS